jgi:hypothetical protein
MKAKDIMSANNNIIVEASILLRRLLKEEP